MTTNTDTTAASGAASQPEALRCAEWLELIAQGGDTANIRELARTTAAGLCRLHALTTAAPAAQEAEPALDESEAEDLARGAFETAMSYGVDFDAFRRLAMEVRRRCPAPRPQADAGAVPAVDREKLIEVIADGLRGTWHCTRVWEAWHVGTMSQDDFELVDESETPSEIADAVLSLIAAAPQAPAAAPAPAAPTIAGGRALCKPQIAEAGEILGAPHADWPEWCRSFAERQAYQCGVADARAIAPAAPTAAAASDEDEALDLLDALFAAWEEGTPCYDEPESAGGFLGNAYRLDDGTFSRCCKILDRRRGRRTPAAPAQDMESVLIDGVAYQTPAPVAAELLRLHLEAMEAPAAGAAPSQHITQPYTVAEIRKRVASGDYSAELLLQHALLHLGAGAAPTDAFWWRKRADEIELAVARSGSTQAMRYYTDMRTLMQAVALRAAATAQEVEDAARYRHIRACNSGSVCVVKLSFVDDADYFILTGEQADREVDAERAVMVARARQEGGAV